MCQKLQNEKSYKVLIEMSKVSFQKKILLHSFHRHSLWLNGMNRQTTVTAHISLLQQTKIMWETWQNIGQMNRKPVICYEKMVQKASKVGGNLQRTACFWDPQIMSHKIATRKCAVYIIINGYTNYFSNHFSACILRKVVNFYLFHLCIFIVCTHH